MAKRELELVEKSKGPDHLETAKALNNLALHHHSLSEYTQADPLFKQALAIRERQLGKDHPEVATSLNNLAMLHSDLGDYSKAEPLYKRALEIRRARLDENHPDLAASLNNLATLYYALGDFEQSSLLLKEAIGIWEKKLGSEDPTLAAALGNLAGLYASTGRNDEADHLLRRALDIREKALGKDHPDTVVMANNLATVLQEEGRYEEAIPLYLRALAVVERTQGTSHPNLAFSLGNLAGLYSSTGQLALAEEYYVRSLAILEESFGPNHPSVAACLENLGSLLAMSMRYAEAHGLFMRAQSIDAEVIDQVFGFTSEKKKYQFLLTKQSSLERSISLVVQHLAANDQDRRDALNLWLSRKGTILEAQRLFQEALVSLDRPEAAQAFQELSRVRDQLSRLAFTAPDPKGKKTYREQISALQTKKQEVESRLSRLSRSYALYRMKSETDCRRISRALPSKSALIELVHLNMCDFGARDPRAQWQPAHYIAFVLEAGDGERVGLVDLGPAEKIDSLVRKLKRSIVHVTRGEGAAKATAEASRELYTLVFEPLKVHIRDARGLFISPDGNLSLIPFEIMQGPDGRYLIDDYAVSYLTSGRDLSSFGQTRETSGKAVLVGNPNFDFALADKHEVGLGRETGTERSALHDNIPFELRGIRFSPLPGTEEELISIRAILGAENAELYTSSQALEEVIRNLRAPGIFHVATHGFFLSSDQFREMVSTIGSRSISLSDASIIEGKGKPLNVNPLLRSGLALAGANRSLASQGGSDGILTGEEVLGLNLRGTDLVVLSACETGLGEIRTGEGVYGLRRAFSQAGAKGLVMSMWSVPDRETKELMVRFYGYLASGKTDRSEALRKAALEQKEVVRQRYNHTSPFFWGAFVFLGEP